MQNKIIIEGASVNNLKNIDVKVPHKKLTVITGVSGSGKSSLAFNTIFAEGQRRFVESLSSYARQFLDKMTKPDVKKISGILPAIAIDQKAPSKNGRSTVGTVTEIYDYLRLLYGRIGKTICRSCGKEIHQDTPQSISEELFAKYLNSKIYVLFPVSAKRPAAEEIEYIRSCGFHRLYDPKKNAIIDINEEDSKAKRIKGFFVLCDRLKLRDEQESKSRLFEATEVAFNHGEGNLAVYVETDEISQIIRYSNKYECADCDIVYTPPEPRLFSFNNPFGACHVCQGFGRDIGIDVDKVIPDKSKTLAKNPVAPWSTPAYKHHYQRMVYALNSHNVSLSTQYRDLSPAQLDLIWNGDGKSFIGINRFFKELESNTNKISNRIMLARYRSYTTCPECGGSRIRSSARQVFVGGKNIPELVQYPISLLLNFLNELNLTPHEQDIAGVIMEELTRRVKLLNDIGLEYLSLDRLTHTLSGGEAQRISLSSAIGASLTSTLYVLDEPSIGLHPRDTERLINVLYELRKLGNTLIVVEHDPDIIKAADNIIDIGPRAGSYGGEVQFAGDFPSLLKSNTLTADYLSNRKKIEISSEPIRSSEMLVINKPRMNNLRMDKVEIPLNCLCTVTGVSGSGKSTLINDFLYERLKKIVPNYATNNGELYNITGYEYISNVEMIDQSPIGRSSRSTPVSYNKTFDSIREAFANTQLAKQLGFKAGHFSFNIPGGRCEECEGEGTISIDMQFLPDLRLKCEACKGTRYKKETRGVLYNGKSIVDVLDMTVDEAIIFFENERKIVNRLLPLQKIGLGYLKLGQPGSTLSGGEAQRLKLSNYMESGTSGGHTLFIFDEPTTGLHIDDINKLLVALRQLVLSGHSVLLIEHNIHVIANSDWIIDMGPEAGFGGGLVVATGTPKDVAKEKKSHTGKALKAFFKEHKA